MRQACTYEQTRPIYCYTLTPICSMATSSRSLWWCRACWLRYLDFHRMIIWTKNSTKMTVCTRDYHRSRVLLEILLTQRRLSCYQLQQYMGNKTSRCCCCNHSSLTGSSLYSCLPKTNIIYPTIESELYYIKQLTKRSKLMFKQTKASTKI